jgi:DNA-binding CsgD family transcriptional regulator
MTTVSPLNSFGTPESATPSAMAILSSMPGIATVVRDEAHAVVACNPTYAFNAGRAAEDLVGTTHRDLRPGSPAADERIELMHAVIESDGARDFLQFWGGKAWLCRVIPLDPEAYGMRGTLSVIMHAPVGTTIADARKIHVLDTADFGDLDALTPAEKRTIFGLAKGRSNNEIAEHQDRSVRTIECHVRAIHDKLGTSTRSAVIRDASERGIQLFTEAQWDKMVGTTPKRRTTPKPPRLAAPAGRDDSIVEPKS